MTQPDSKQPVLFGPWIACPECGNVHPRVLPDLFAAYFGAVPVECPSCGKPIDWWLAILSATRKHFMLTGAFQVLGANTTIFEASLRKETVTLIDFVSQGVPEQAIILSVNYTGQGELLPIQIHSNVPRYDPLNKEVAVYGASFGKDLPDAGVAVAVTWIAPGFDEIGIRQLIDAARAYDAKRYDSLIVPANVAVESALGTAMYDWLTAFCGKERVETFLADAATYSHQLNVLLPVACYTIGVKPLPEHIRGVLNQLRGLRNDVAHRGVLSISPSKDLAAEILTAAVFGFNYAQLFHAQVKRARSIGKLPA
jgi:hypothetical protein